jgi:hypothetical protein
MAALWTVPGINHFVIGTDRDKMGLNDWEIYIVDLSTGTVTDETANVTVEEIVYNIDSPATGTVATDVAAGSKILPLKDGDGANFKAGMKIKVTTVDGDEYKEIRKVTGDTLTFYKPLKSNVVADTDNDGTADNTVTQVGNTGDYRVVVDSTKLTTNLVAGGDYQVQATSAEGEIDITSDIFHATDYDYDNLGSDIASIKQGMDNLLNGGLGGARIYL